MQSCTAAEAIRPESFKAASTLPCCCHAHLAALALESSGLSQACLPPAPQHSTASADQRLADQRLAGQCLAGQCLVHMQLGHHHRRPGRVWPVLAVVTPGGCRDMNDNHMSAQAQAARVDVRRRRYHMHCDYSTSCHARCTNKLCNMPWAVPPTFSIIVAYQAAHLHMLEHLAPASKHSQYFFRQRDLRQRQPFLCRDVPPLPASGSTCTMHMLLSG